LLGPAGADVAILRSNQDPGPAPRGGMADEPAVNGTIAARRLVTQQTALRFRRMGRWEASGDRPSRLTTR
jgi:hypothetical protein